MSCHSCSRLCDIDGAHEIIKYNPNNEAWYPSKNELIGYLFDIMFKIMALSEESETDDCEDDLNG